LQVQRSEPTSVPTLLRRIPDMLLPATCPEQFRRSLSLGNKLVLLVPGEWNFSYPATRWTLMAAAITRMVPEGTMVAVPCRCTMEILAAREPEVEARV